MWLKTHLWRVHTEMMDAETPRQAALHPGEATRFHVACAWNSAPVQRLEQLDGRYGRGISRALKTLEREEKLALRAERRRRAARTRPSAAPKKDEIEAPNLTAPATRGVSRVFAAQQICASATSKIVEIEAPNLPAAPGPVFGTFRRKIVEIEAPNPTAPESTAPKIVEIKAPNPTQLHLAAGAP